MSIILSAVKEADKKQSKQTNKKHQYILAIINAWIETQLISLILLLLECAKTKQ